MSSRQKLNSEQKDETLDSSDPMAQMLMLGAVFYSGFFAFINKIRRDFKMFF